MAAQTLAQATREIKTRGTSHKDAQENRNHLADVNVRLTAELGRRPTTAELMEAL